MKPLEICHVRTKHGSQMPSTWFSHGFKRTLIQHLKIDEVCYFKNSKLLQSLENRKKLVRLGQYYHMTAEGYSRSAALPLNKVDPSS